MVLLCMRYRCGSDGPSTITLQNIELSSQDSGSPTVGIDQIRVFLDSALVVNQVNGNWKIEAEHLKPLWMEAHALVREFADIEISWVARKENAEAGAPAGRALKAERGR